MGRFTSKYNFAKRLMTRRSFLQKTLSVAGAISVGAIGGSAGFHPRVARASGGADDFGPLSSADSNGLQLPVGFTSRIVALADEEVGTTGFNWPRAPDGGATFATGDGGWIYVANSELSGGNGGVSAIRFAPNGDIIDAYSILSGTSRNCAGGPTPWGTWLSCEETDTGRTWECDPFTPSQGVELPALGTFKHEAAAVDPVHQVVYQTEDTSTGLLYRFLPTTYPDLSSGTLEAAEILDPNGDGPIAPGQVRPLAWHFISSANPPGGGSDDPNAPLAQRATRYQAPAATEFPRGEGAWYENGMVYFATTTNNRVWAIDTAAQTIEIIYDRATSGDPELSGADNVFASTAGDVYIAEDGGNMEIVALTPSGDVKPVVRVVGHSGSEVAGPALSPDGTRLYFSSQRGPTPGGNNGVTFEVTGPWICQPTGIDEIPDLPQLSLAAAPNPFRSETRLHFTTATNGGVRLTVYDVLGRRVRTLVDAQRSAGDHASSWDGKSDGGIRVAAGIYFVRLETGGGVTARKVYLRN